IRFRNPPRQRWQHLGSTLSDWFWWFGDYNPPEAVRDVYRASQAALALSAKEGANCCCSID
ncbi:MAG: hypothetical protein EB157_05730, partial [Euryarchaeota archaeon]|nr:hypothetical protein [Euryarchaeota archaeon]